MGIHRSKAPTVRHNQLDGEERKGEHRGDQLERHSHWSKEEMMIALSLCSEDGEK